MPTDTKSAIANWPEAERPRERMARHGAQGLSQAELLALILRSGRQGHSALDLAREILSQVEALGGWDKVRPGDLAKVKGVGPAKAAGLIAALEWSRRREQDKSVEKALINSSASAHAYFAPWLRDERKEVVMVAALDAKLRVLASEKVSGGTVEQALAHPRDVFRVALAREASRLVVAHNHPSGDPTPSRDDHALTRRLRQAGEILSVHLMDHVVIGQDGYFSFADHGWPE